MPVSFIFTYKSQHRGKKSLEKDEHVPKMPVSGGYIERCPTGSSLRLFNLLYCKYLIPLRCLLATSGRINRRGARQRGQNEYLRLSDMPLPAFSLHLEVAGLTHRATWHNTVSTNDMFADAVLEYTFVLSQSYLFYFYLLSIWFGVVHTVQ